MNALDRLQYYETFYDSFCSEFAIPRAHTSHSSSSGPSSIAEPSSSCNYQQFGRQRCKSNGKLSNNVYYFDTFSDAFASPQQEEDQKPVFGDALGFRRFHASDPDFYLDYYKDNQPLNQFTVPHHHYYVDQAHDFSEPYCSVSFFRNPDSRNKGPTPPPKPAKIKQISEYHPQPPPPPPADNYSNSIPDFFQEMELTGNSSPVAENGGGAGACGPPNRYFHQSFESIASCPVPPPPKYIRAPHTRHLSVEQFPPYGTSYDPNPSSGDNFRKFSQPHVNRRDHPLSLSDFLKLTSNNVFRKPPFGSRKQSAGSLLPCGHLQNSSGNATSSTSPTPSASSVGEESRNRSKEEGGRSSVFSFRKKCGVTKRRKKIDESLFVPTSSCEVLTTSSQNNNTTNKSTKNNSSNSIAVHHNMADDINNGNAAAVAADSFHYSITNAASPSPSIMMMAETNHDTEFELDPLPEKSCDDVLDFTWTLSPVAPDEMDGNTGTSSSKKKTGRKQSNSSQTAGGNGRPSSRCSLIINSLMGHLSGLTKTTQEQPQESHRHHQYSPKRSSSNNNNNFAHLLDHRHNHNADHYQQQQHHHHSAEDPPAAPDEYDNHQNHNPSSSKKFDREVKAVKASKDGSMERKAFPVSDSFTPPVTTAGNRNSHNRTTPRGDLHNPDDNDYTGDSGQLKRLGNKRDQQRSERSCSNSDMLMMTTAAVTSSSTNEKTYQSQQNGSLAPSSSQPQETNAHSRFIRNATANIRRRPRSLAAFNLDIDAILPVGEAEPEQYSSNQQQQLRRKSFFYPARGSKYEENCTRSGSKSLSNIDFVDTEDFANTEHFAMHANRHDDSVPGFGNVIGCIPRVSLSNIKTKQHHQGLAQQQQRGSRAHDALNGYHHDHQQQQQLKPRFVVGGSSSSGSSNANINYGICHREQADQQPYHNAQQRQRTCSGLFCADDDCCCDDDKYDKYYGQYSLTGLNIPMLASASSLSSTSQPHNNMSNGALTAAKSAEELVLDRYYAHCNKIVRSKPVLPPTQQQPDKESKKQKKKYKSSIFNKGKRTCSLPEKIWKNVSLPLISSTNNSNNNNDGSSLLCDHHKAKQIEECIYCINEQEQQQRTHFNQHKSSRTSGRLRKTAELEPPLFAAFEEGEGRNHHHHHHPSHPKSVRDLLGNSNGVRSEAVRRGGGQLIKLKKVSTSTAGSNKIITGQRQDGNVNRFQYHSVYDHDVIGELSSSSLSSSFTTTAASVSVHHHHHHRSHQKPPLLKRNNKKQKKCVISSSGCLNGLISTSEEESCDENDRRTATTVAATSLKSVGVHAKRKSFSCDNFIRAEQVDDDDEEDYDIDKGQGQLAVKVKTGAKTKRRENSGVKKRHSIAAEEAAGELTRGQRKKHLSGSGNGNSNNRSSFGVQASRSAESIINGYELRYDKNDENDEPIDDDYDGVIRVKSSRENRRVHLGKLKRSQGGGDGGNTTTIAAVEMNPLITGNEKVIIEDGNSSSSSSSSSSIISSLPTSQTSSSRQYHQHRQDHDQSNGVAKEKESKTPAGTKNRVKWTFLTSGLAKATRKLSSGSSSRSSLNSFTTTTSSDSGASSRSSSGGSSSPSSKKEDSSENTSTSSSCASSGIEVGRKSGKNKSSSSNIIRTTFLKKQVGGNGDDDDDNAIVQEGPTEKLKSKNEPRKGTDVKRRRNTAEVFFNDAGAASSGKTSISNSNATTATSKNVLFQQHQQRHGKSSVLAVPNRTASLRRRPSYYNAKRQRPFTIQAVPSAAAVQKKSMSVGQAGGGGVISSATTPSVFLRKPLRFPHLTRVVSAPVDSSQNINNIFSAFSNVSCASSGSNRSSTSGYTSNVSRRTSEFLKSFRKRWAKKNNKVADGDEEDASRSTHNKKDDGDDDEDDDQDEGNGGVNDGNVQNDNNHCHYPTHDKVQNNTSAMTPFGGTVNRLSLIRKKRRNSSRASKQAIFSTFYIGPAIKDPMEEEKIYVTKDFDDVVLDLQSGEVKKTCDGTILFTADPLCFASKDKLKNKSKKLRLKLGRKSEKTQKSQEHHFMMKAEVHQQKKGSKENRKSGVGEKVGGSGQQQTTTGFSKKNDNAITCSNDHHKATFEINNSARKSGGVNSANPGNRRANKTRDKNNEAYFYYSKKSGERKNDNDTEATTAAGTVKMMPSESSKKNQRVSGGTSGFIKRGFGISKDFLVVGGGRGGTCANFKNQSADDICGSSAGDNAPDTPTRSSNGLLGRLRDSSRSGFGFSSSGNGGSRSSSKKRSSSRHDTINTTGGTGGFEVSQTDSPSATQKSRNSLSDCVGARGNTDANDQGVGVSGKLSTGHNHQPSCSSEEELTSINSCENRLSSLTLGGGGGSDGGGEGEYNGPFQGRAVALVDCEPSPYDRHALRYKKGDIIEIISKKPTGLWTGKVNSQIGSFKFINVKLLPNLASSSAEKYDVDRNQRRVGGEEDEEDDDDAEGDEVIDGDDSAGDYADTSNYQCSLHYNSRASNNANAAAAGVGEECCCPPPPSSSRGRRNDPHHHQSPGAATRECRGNSKRLAGALTPWDVATVEQRQSVANVINGYGGIGSNKDKRSKERGMYHGDPLGIMNDDEEDDENEEGEEAENDEEIDDDDEEAGDSAEDEEAESLEAGNGDGVTNQVSQLTEKDVKCQKSKSGKPGATTNKKTGQEIDGRKAGKKQASLIGKGRPRTVGDLLQRINLEKYALELEKHGFESLDILKELEEEDLDAIGISDGADRTKILTAVELLREWDIETDRIPGQTYYQYRYYLTTQKTPKGARTAAAAASGGSVVAAGSQTLGVKSKTGQQQQTQQQQQGSPAQIQQQGHTTTNAGMPSPHFYRLHHPRDSGIFVGKVDGEEDGDEPISGADLSCAESHPDAETEEIILSPINLQKTSSASVGVAGGGGGGAASGNPNAAWHSQNHHNNNNKQGSHHHINRFISKGAPAGIMPSSNNNASSNSNSTGSAGAVQTAQQPTSSASSSGSSSSSSGITTTGDSFWNSVSSSNNSNGSGGSSSASSGDGAGTSSIVVDQNHSQWTKQQQTRDHPASSGVHHRKRDSSPAYNTDSVRNRFLQAKSLFETSNNCSGGSGPVSAAPAITATTAAVGGKPARATGHVYENGGAILLEGDGSGSGIMESQTHQLHLQRGGSQGKSLSQQQQQQQNRFLYCEKSSDSGISVCTNSPPPLRNEFRN